MQSNKKDDTLFLIPETDLVASTIEKTRNFFWDELKKNSDAHHNIILDVQGIEVVDSLGVNLIIGLYRQINSEHKNFSIINGGKKFMKIASFFRFPTLFTVKAEEE
ncbi:MAG: STAS domain-containing protein [Desulfobacterales bacterium]|nr:STAS domain-containing protein [Desulfobacterales bacterium]